MTLQERINAFIKLGKRISLLESQELDDLARRVENGNSWFTRESVKNALDSLVLLLEEDALHQWANKYPIQDDVDSKEVGVMMAGNVPAVGFHDMMSVLISGHKMHAKLSSTDEYLMRWIGNELILIDPRFESVISFQDMLKDKDAYIATGSDNSARYFDYYFGKYPHIIRKNRTSVAVLRGDETAEDYMALGKDIFLYFGLGCRNISKLYINKIEQLQDFLGAIESYNSIIHHHKYRNNYDYNKSIYLVNQRPHLDNGFLLLTTDDNLVSPISVLYYELYEDQNDLESKLDTHQDKIQCVVSKDGRIAGSIPFGEAQCPGVQDYADDVDTMEFLISLYE
ncbi:MAG TPA: acyl-CoA reductase [Anditalea sp.]|nr:acyl-CoA reductase [Anditalea sp.]